MFKKNGNAIFNHPPSDSFLKLISSLKDIALTAKPTDTHKFIASLCSSKKNVDIITTNLDGLESVALNAINRDKQSSVYQMHGNIEFVYCSSINCPTLPNSTEIPLSSDILASYKNGAVPACPHCQKKRSEEKQYNEKARDAALQIGDLYPCVLLYGDFISRYALSKSNETAKYLSQFKKKCDVFLVIGMFQ